jgi:hypothetical protein
MTINIAPQQIAPAAEATAVSTTTVVVRITSPLDGAVLNGRAVEQPITISGYADKDPRTTNISMPVKVQFAGTEQTVQATGTAGEPALWSTTAIVPPFAGPRSMSAVVDLSTPITPGPSDIHVIHVNVQDTVAPNVAITAPLAGTSIDNNVDGACSIQVEANVTDYFGVVGAECRVGNDWIALSAAGGAVWRKADVALPVGSFGPQTIRVRARDAAGNVSPEKTVAVTVPDKTKPVGEIIAPAEGDPLPSGTVTIRGRVRDLQSGVASVSWSFDNSPGSFHPATTLEPPVADGWRNWSVTLTDVKTGFYSVHVKFVDVASNETTGVCHFEVSDYQATTVEQLLEPRAYLEALLKFVFDHVRVSGAAGAAPVTTDLLQQVLRQPFGALKEALPAGGDLAIRNQPVNQLRIAIEILRRHLAAQSGLIAHWRFEEGSGAVARDATFRGNSATLVNNPGWASGRFGGALSFDGSNYAKVASTPELEVGKNGADFSVAFWLYLTKPGAGQHRRIICKSGGDTGNGQRTFAMFMNPNDNGIHYCISTQTNPNVYGYSTRKVALNAWTHVAYVKAGNQLRLYIDGAAEAPVTLPSASVHNTSPLYFGNVDWSPNPLPGFDGSLDDIRLYNVALSAQAITALAGAVDPPGTTSERDYRLAAYESLLARIGTSYEEIRLMRGAKDEERQALADRLGIAKEALAQLFVAPDGLTEEWLEGMFGLSGTLREDPLARPSTPRLLGWQRDLLQQQWSADDNVRTVPIVDSDLIGSADLRNPVAGNEAYDLWAERRQTVQHDYDTLKQKREEKGADLVAGFNAAATVAFGQPVDLDALESDDLGPLCLTTQTLLVLRRIRTLARSGPVTEAEWADVYGILTQVMKQRLHYADWRGKERDKHVTLSSRLFRIADLAVALPAWRASDVARQAWQDALRTRIAAEQALEQSLADAVDATEQATLSLLRDALIGPIAGPAGVGETADLLTARLLIDEKGSGAVKTTRVEQAIETVQELVSSLRTSQLDSGHPAAAWNPLGAEQGGTPEREQAFDQEWRWLGSYANWRAAMFAFLYPENLLLPSLRQDQTGAFTRLAGKLQEGGRLTSAAARAAAAAYLSDLDADTGPGLDTDIVRDRLVAHWPLNEGQTTHAADVTGNASPGELNGPSWVARGTDQALSFDGINDFVEVTAGSMLGDLVNSFTIAFWASPTDTIGGDWTEPERQSGPAQSNPGRVVFSPLLGGDDSAGACIAIGTDGIKVRALSYPNDFPALLVHRTTLSGWTHIAVAFQDGQPSLYVNGVFVRRGQKSSKGNVHACPRAFGDPIYLGSYFKGQLQDVRIYDHALPSQAIARLKDVKVLPMRLRSPFGITDQLSDQDLRDRRALAQTMLQGGGVNSPAYLKEIFYFVPLQIALQLQKSGEYVAALDWFQSVYAWNLPAADRKIYPLLDSEGMPTAPLPIDPHWARDLNPHQTVAPLPSGSPVRPYPYTRYTLLSLVRCFLDFADAEFARYSGESVAHARSLYATARELLRRPELPAPGAFELGRILPNPLIDALRLRVEIQLAKIRQGRNIAGVQRELAVDAGPATALDMLSVGGSGQRAAPRTVAPAVTPYRFKVLIERSKQLVAIAQQIEAAYLAALEKRDAENYNLLKASNDLQLAAAGEELQRRRINEAQDGRVLIDKQKTRNQTLKDAYNDMINAGLNQYEQAMIASFLAGGEARIYANQFNTAAQIAGLATLDAAKAATIPVQAGLMMAGGLFTNLATMADMVGHVASVNASFERQKQQWQLQVTLADKDTDILAVQGRLADDHLGIVQQEQTIARIQSTHTRAVADFLAHKFTNAELYDFMSGVLRDVYSYFLQQGTAMAQLAWSQLAFERAEQPPAFIQADYWEPPSQGGGLVATQTPDRRGLTGSARLLQDITQLDQFAFESDKRKLNISQSFSLAQLWPYQFQRFRDTGVLSFTTGMELFDRAFPGHYLRLIKRVRTSVIALIPPVQGIRATLAASGSSTVVAGDAFTPVPVVRDPELVALTSPSNATGLFELDMQSEMRQPFEDRGVDTNWEFRLPKAANAFDFNSIADVLVTIDYTALDSADYRAAVIRRLDRAASAQRAFSLRDFVDGWYVFNNPVDPAAPIALTFRIRREHFPPNLRNDEIRIEQLLACFVPRDGVTLPTIKVANLYRGTADSPARPAQADGSGVISTGQSSGASWRNITGTPVGDWTLTISDADTARLFTDGKIDDILFVVTYGAELPAWT